MVSFRLFIPPLYRTHGSSASLLVGLLAICSNPGAVEAHSNAQLEMRIAVVGTQLDAQMVLELRDLRHLVSIDNNDDGRIDARELTDVREDLAKYLQRYLRIDQDPGATPCPGQLVGMQARDFSSVQVHLRFTCPEHVTAFSLNSGLFAGTRHDYGLKVLATRHEQQQQVELNHSQNRAQIVFADETTPFYVVLFAAAGALVVVGLALLWFWRRQAAAKHNR